MKIFNWFKNILKKLNIYVNTDNMLAEKGKIFKLAGVATGAILCAALFSAFFTTGYEVYLGGDMVAVVYNKSDFENLFSSANEKIVEIAGKGYGINKIPKYVFTVATKSKITCTEEMMENVMKQSSVVELVYYINVDGEDVAWAKSENEANMFTEKAAGTYGGENIKILNDIKIVPRYEKIKYFPGEKISVENLVSVLRVQTESEETYLADVTYGREEKTSDDMYVNERKTISEGENGVMEVTAKVTKINGKASQVDIVSQTITKKPLKEVVMVGSIPVPSIGTGEFIQPFYGLITSRFGQERNRNHQGLDIAGETGEPILAADNGVVAVAEYNDNGYGNLVIIDHNNGFVTYYAHLHEIDVKEGDVVQKGETVGLLGNTGRSTGPHLHFEVREDGVPINPETYLEEIE